VCAGLLGWSHRLSEGSSDLTNAVRVAQSAAETFKIYPAADEMAYALGAWYYPQGAPRSDGGSMYAVFFDKGWNTVSPDPAQTYYTMQILVAEDNGFRSASILVSDRRGEEIFQLSTADIN
jgi:hypothetical protein